MVTDLDFAVLDAHPERYAATPTVTLRVRITERTGASIQAIHLRMLIQIEPRRRHYTVTEESRLFELFGESSRWGDTLKTVTWTNTSLVVPAFTGSVEVDVPIGVTYDFEVASAKYFHGLEEGEIPLLLLFSGTVFHHGPTGLAIDQVPWHKETPFRLPVAVWRETMDTFFPDSAWIRLRRDTFDALHRFKGSAAVPTWEEAIEILLRRAGEGERV